jgi:hypothetical protein
MEDVLSPPSPERIEVGLEARDLVLESVVYAQVKRARDRSAGMFISERNHRVGGVMRTQPDERRSAPSSQRGWRP